ncbi:hypothetical protein PAEPH01_1407 [Pancytospora epiphaga]|nr:hypothetical protein PAEPH01_1407 [Pancytospora epiphaga]
MEMLQKYIDNKEHGKILSLTEKWTEPYRTIAAIYLERFDLALRLVKKKTFEHAYILYRMKRHRNAVRILNKLEGTNVDILRAQCLYNLGYYREAYICLLSKGDSDEFAVNLAAITSMCKLSELGRYRPLVVAPKYRGSISESKFVPKFKDSECNAEYEHNLLFRHLGDRHEYLKLLGELDTKLGGKCPPVSKQIQLLCDKDLVGLSKREQEIVDFNVGKNTTITNPVHFQKNYIAKTQENELIKASIGLSTGLSVGITGGIISYKEIKPETDMARIMKAFLYIKAKPGNFSHDFVKNTLKECGDCLEKEILLLIASNLDRPFEQKAATEILLNTK